MPIHIVFFPPMLNRWKKLLAESTSPTLQLPKISWSVSKKMK